MLAMFQGLFFNKPYFLPNPGRKTCVLVQHVSCFLSLSCKKMTFRIVITQYCKHIKKKPGMIIF